jgi:peptidoglycan hydrolase-like protein with peptidoglycan-binding domain
MRRALLITLGVGLLAAAPAAADPNPQTVGLQVALRAHGLYKGEIDGIRGPATVRAVRIFQRRRHLLVDGIPGPRTRRALGRLGVPLFGKRAIAPGATGWDVSVLQFLLTTRGFSPGGVDGHFGPGTKAALARYQRSVHLRPDGIAGPRTIAALSLATRVPVQTHAVHGKTYVVRPGDTLTAIARRHGTTVHLLARANGLDPSRFLLIGTRIRVPTRVNTPTIADPFSVRLSLDHWSAHYGVDARLSRALAWQESGYQPSVVSVVGAQGVMQLLPTTWDFVETIVIGRRIPHTTDGNVRIGIAYLRHLLREFAGDERLALGAWYQGAAAVRRHGLYTETRAFVANVLALKQRM